MVGTDNRFIFSSLSVVFFHVLLSFLLLLYSLLLLLLHLLPSSRPWVPSLVGCPGLWGSRAELWQVPSPQAALPEAPSVGVFPFFLSFGPSSDVSQPLSSLPSALSPYAHSSLPSLAKGKVPGWPLSRGRASGPFGQFGRAASLPASHATALSLPLRLPP